MKLNTIQLLKKMTPSSDGVYFQPNLNSTQDKVSFSFSIGASVYTRNQKLNKWKKHSVEFKNSRGSLKILKKIPNVIWKHTPIKSHSFIQSKKELDEISKNVQSAQNILEKKVEPIWAYSKHFLSALAFVKLNKNMYQKEAEVTSITLPGFPYISFLSKKSLFHVPPHILSQVEDEYFLAENILHESAHQIVNFGLIDRGWLNELFQSKKSATITIPWRKNQPIMRNKKWPLDRCLHASVVYLFVAVFRQKNLDRYNSKNISDAVKNGKFLLEKLFKHRAYFTSEGLSILGALKNDFENIEKEMS